MALREVSPAEIHRQVLREGARHGLRPVMKNGKCHVAQRELVMESGPTVSAAVERWEPFRDVDVDHPLGNIWRSRKQRHQHDMTKLLMQRHADDEARKEAAHADFRAQQRKEIETVVRSVGLPDFWRAVSEVRGGKPHAG